ncbi:MAG TPA: restriction endonuclease subunit M [Chryseobacterium sp.]|nr:restriction endonuclease subunit M [Chryseobacterium sp.]
MKYFQNSVLNKYPKAQDSFAIKVAYKKFTAHFNDAGIQENIRNSKEEQYQGEFLIDLFVNVLGYTKNPATGFNITTEYKNVKDSKKADGAILINGVVKAVIELKGTETTDLNRIEAQAFGYKNNQPECVYVITSNFEKLRFYIDNAIENIEFNLFTLTEKEFELLWLCLAFVNIEKNLAKRIKDESVSQEDVITKNLYNDYSLFKRELHQNLVALNPDHDPLTLFKKSQKLLDRFLFLFFAEDRQLLPPNSVRLILDDWRDLQDRDVEIALYARFKKYFEYLNTGFKGKRYDVFAYNGGLFKTDELLDGLKIDDELLYRHTLKLSEYDFVSEVDVNILGHIFENSLNELDEIKAQLEGQQVDKAKSKRKKDGVFYTPKYITKYIVDNTVGKLCSEKKAEIGLIEEKYITDRKRTKKTIQPLFEKLTIYRDWLLQLTICDPACGSGAFLNQALDFLINEHRYIDELQAKLFGDAMVLSDFEKNILENNLFGVDLNEESVEIAKLSLWLRTAQPNRKLNDLNNNIKCGNSLIDDPAVAGDKAFNWQNEFPAVFEKGGFDVVIGNPPYVQLQSMGEMSDILSKCGYQTYNKGADLYCLFYERGCQILKPYGYLGFITSNKWFRVNYGESLRKFLSTKVNPTKLIDFPGIPVFADAVVDPHILILTNEAYQSKTASCTIKKNPVDLETLFESNKTTRKFSSESWIIVPFDEYNKLEQMKFKGTELKALPINIYRGILTGFNDAFYIDAETYQELIDLDANSKAIIKPMVRGRNIVAYSISSSEYLINTHNGLKEKNPPVPPVNIDNYPAVKKHLDAFYPMLEKRGDKGDTPYNLRNCSYLEDFLKPKIIFPNMTSIFPFMYDETGMLTNQKCFILTAHDESVSLLFLTALFNSSLAKIWIWWNCPELGDNRRELSKVYFEHFPVPPANEAQTDKLAQFATERSRLTAKLQSITLKFQRTLQRRLNLEELPGKLQNWYFLSYKEFIAELAKKKVKLSLAEEAEWEAYFLQEASQALAIKSEIEKTDKEIDWMVYELYGLTEEEIGIVEGN